jgi:hypothetical protein
MVRTVPPRKRDLWISLALAATLTAVYSANGEVLPGNDATGSVYLAANLLEEGRVSFSASRDPRLFSWTLPDGTDVRLASLDQPVLGVPARDLRAEGRLRPAPRYFLVRTARPDPATGEVLYLNTFGPGAALAALPVLAPLRVLAGDLRAHPEVLWFGAKLAASLLVAASAVFVFLTARRWVEPRPAVALALAYGLGTAVWSTSSQTLWQHGASECFLAGGVYFLCRARDRLRDAAWSGALLAAAVACRPTSAILAVAAALYLLRVDRRAFAALAMAALPLAAALAAHNAWHLGSMFRFGQTEISRAIALQKTGSADLWQTPILAGVAGVLASPSRGLLVFSPWLVLAVPGAALAWRDAERWGALRAVSLGALAMLLVEARWFDWWGGWCYGWRRLADLAPLLAVLAIPVARSAIATRARAAVLALAVGWSVAVQALGAFAYDVDGWNSRTVYSVRFADGAVKEAGSFAEARDLLGSPGAQALSRTSLDVDLAGNRHRLWSVRDSQIGYYVEHLTAAVAAKRAGSARWIASWRG